LLGLWKLCHAGCPDAGPDAAPDQRFRVCSNEHEYFDRLLLQVQFLQLWKPFDEQQELHERRLQFNLQVLWKQRRLAGNFLLLRHLRLA
jgi:hypothetical protein